MSSKKTKAAKKAAPKKAPKKRPAPKAKTKGVRKDGKADGRSVNRTKHLTKLASLLKAPQTVKGCAKSLRVTDRAVYLYLKQLMRDGHKVVRMGERTNGKYQILARAKAA